MGLSQTGVEPITGDCLQVIGANTWRTGSTQALEYLQGGGGGLEYIMTNKRKPR